MRFCTQTFFIPLFLCLYLFSSCDGLGKKQSSNRESALVSIKSDIEILSDSDYLMLADMKMERLEAEREERRQALFLSDWQLDWDENDYYLVDEIGELPSYEKKMLEWYGSNIVDSESQFYDSSVLLDSMTTAYSFLKNSLGFTGFFEYYYFPDHYEMKDYKKHGDNDFAARVVRMIPSEDRVANLYIHLSDEGYEGAVAFNQVWNYILKNRSAIGFYDLYTFGKGVIHKIIPKREYEKGLNREVNRLLMAYDDIQNDDNLLYEIAVMMKDHETKLENPTFETVGTYEDMIYPFLKKVIPADSHDAIIADADSDYLGYDAALLVWYYSFWLRRTLEGNADDVYRTLEAIKDDYSAM